LVPEQLKLAGLWSTRWVAAYAGKVSGQHLWAIRFESVLCTAGWIDGAAQLKEAAESCPALGGKQLGKCGWVVLIKRLKD
jgi:hypothetical protein